MKNALTLVVACLLALPATGARAEAESADHPLLDLAREMQKKRKPDLRVAPGAPELRQAEHSLDQAKAPADSECAGSIGALRFAELHADLALAHTGQGDFAGAAIGCGRATRRSWRRSPVSCSMLAITSPHARLSMPRSQSHRVQ